MALMFGRNNRTSNQPKNLVEFKAGKMVLKGNMVHPDKRKGLVYVYQSEDGLTHFCWKDRTSGVVEDDLIIFPEDAVFSKVTQCKEESRVYLLKFKASSRKLFYWMQEPKADGDNAVMTKVNDAINNPGGSGSRGENPTGYTSPEQDVQSLLQSMSHSQLMQLFGGMQGMGLQDLEGASNLLSQMGFGNASANSTSENRSSGGQVGTTTAAPRTPQNNATTTSKKPEESATAKSGASSSKPAVQLQDLQKILSGMQQSSPVDLSAGISSDFVKRITASPDTVKKLTPLLGFPTNESDTDEKKVAETLVSPAFQNALSSFCSAFPSGQLGPLVEQFHFGKEAIQAARMGNLEAFINAIQNEVDTQSPEKAEDMNLD